MSNLFKRIYALSSDAKIGIICIFSLIMTLVLQYSFNKQPCSLCVVQRMLVLTLGVVSGIKIFQDFLAEKILHSIQWIVWGLLVASGLYHLRLLNFKGLTCSDSISSFVLNFNFAVPALNWIFEAKSVCGQGDDYWIGLPIPAWVLALTLLFAMLLAQSPKSFSKK